MSAHICDQWRAYWGVISEENELKSSADRISAMSTAVLMIIDIFIPRVSSYPATHILTSKQSKRDLALS